MIKVLHKALNILEVVANSSEGLTLSEIASSIDEKDTTTSNIVQVLYKRKYLEKLPGKSGYKLGSSSYMLSDSSGGMYGDTLREAASGVLTRLTKETNAESVLTIWRNGDRHVLLRIQDNNPITVNDKQGEANIYEKATGIMLLACRDENTIREYIKKNGLPSERDFPVSDEEEFIYKLEEIRKKGYFSRDRGMVFEAAASVGLGNGAVDTVIGLHIPSFLVSNQIALINYLRLAAAELSSMYPFDWRKTKI